MLAQLADNINICYYSMCHVSYFIMVDLDICVILITVPDTVPCVVLINVHCCFLYILTCKFTCLTSLFAQLMTINKWSAYS